MLKRSQPWAKTTRIELVNNFPRLRHSGFTMMNEHSCLTLAFQLLTMPEDVIVEIACRLDPRSLLHVSQAHPRLAPFLTDNIIWEQVSMCDNWAYHNEMFLFMWQFCNKIKCVTYKCTNICNPCLSTFPESVLMQMSNLSNLYVSSPYFSRPYFLRYTPLIEVIRFSNCPLLDMDIFVQRISLLKPNRLRILDFTGVPSVTSLHMWSISYACTNLCELYSTNRMSSFFGEQILQNCLKLEVLDCLPLLGNVQEWHNFRSKTHITFGPLMLGELQK